MLWLRLYLVTCTLEIYHRLPELCFRQFGWLLFGCLGFFSNWLSLTKILFFVCCYFQVKHHLSKLVRIYWCLRRYRVLFHLRLLYETEWLTCFGCFSTLVKTLSCHIPLLFCLWVFFLLSYLFALRVPLWNDHASESGILWWTTTTMF